MRLPLTLTLLAAIALLALASPAVKWLIERGGEAGLASPGAISFCNVLFVGNLCGGCLTLVFFGPRRIVRDLLAMGWTTRWLMAAAVVLATAIPTLLFIALSTTTVTNLVLLGRMESVAYALLAIAFFRNRLTRSQWLGYGIIVAGVITLVLIRGMWQLTKGDVLVLSAAVLQGLAACLTRRLLEGCSVRALVFARNLFSAIVFFWIAVAAYGFGHFAEAFASSIWMVMTVYALAIVVLGQLAWYRALGSLSPTTVVNWSMLSPVLGVLFAYLLLQERPETAHWIGGVIILVGMAFCAAGSRGKEPPRPPVETTLAAAG